ncbi:MAG: hypothetical protein QNI84_17400 [Henriciella sp.]|nr:hypothetical protein [Henriciella sp.]
MTRKPIHNYQRPGTRISKDGCTVFARLRIDRRVFERGRSWAKFHSAADPGCTAEDIIEGELNMDGQKAIDREGYEAPADVEANYPKPQPASKTAEEIDDDMPF